MEKNLYLHRVLNDNNSETAHFLLTKSGEILACNPFASVMFKYDSPQNLINMDFRSLVPDEFASYMPAEITLEHLTNGLFAKRINKCRDNNLIATLIKTCFVELDNETYIECLVKYDPDTNVSLEVLLYKQMSELLKSEVMRLKNELNPSDEMTYFHHDLAFGLAKKHEGLKTREVIFCSLILAGLQTKEIAEILCITSESAYKFRKRLRKKMDLTAKDDLFEYLKTIIVENQL
ncbi:MAG: helix-turn-helix transcriptional regulator [Bacteroidales bacterium]